MKLTTALSVPLLTTAIQAGKYPSTDTYFSAPDYPGNCPKVTPSKNYQFEPSLGLWWNVAISPFFWHFRDSTCAAIEVKDHEDREGYVRIRGTAITPNGHRSIVNGLGITDDHGSERTTGYWSVSYFMEPKHFQDNWVVLDTDNDSYAYVWDCTEKKANKLSRAFGAEDTYSPVIWINVRDQNMSDEDINMHIDRFNQLMKNKFGWDRAEEFGETIFTIDCNDCERP